MTTATIVTGDSPGNFGLTSAVINENAASPVTDITTNPGPYGGIVNIAPPTKADVPNTVGPIRQEFTLTVNGTGYVTGRIGIYGSNDGANWTKYGEATARGVAPVSVTHKTTNPATYWTAVPEFCSPGATINVSMTF